LVSSGFVSGSPIIQYDSGICVEHRLRVFENRVLNGKFGPKRDAVIRGLRKLHNKEIRKLYSSLSIIRVIKLTKGDGQGM
jgi:hypothetical protein